MWSLGVVFFCVPITLFWLLVFVKDHHLEVSHHLFDISGEEHMAIQRQNPVWHHKPQGKVGIIKTPDWGLWTLPDCLHPSLAILLKKKKIKRTIVGLGFWCVFGLFCRTVSRPFCKDNGELCAWRLKEKEEYGQVPQTFLPIYKNKPKGTLKTSS